MAGPVTTWRLFGFGQKTYSKYSNAPIIERCLIVCFVFVFLHIHDLGLSFAFRFFSFRFDSPPPLNGCLLSNYHKQIRPRLISVSDTSDPLVAANFSVSQQPSFRGPDLQTEVLKLLATRRSERRFCCVDPWVITILYSNFKCYWLLHPTSPLSYSHGGESAYFPKHYSCLFAWQDHWVATRRRCVLMAIVITRSWT